MVIPFKQDPFELDQRILFPTNIFDLLPGDHPCFIYEEIFRQLDTSSVEGKYSVRGQNAYHPRLILGILIYAYSHGVFSSREIEQRCREDLAFMYISHMNCPNFRVLSDFRKENYEFFKECFKQSVLIAMLMGLVSFGHVSLDGSKFKANTSKHKAMSYGRLKAKEKELIEEIEALVFKAQRCDEEEDEQYREKSGYEIPQELKIKEKRLAKIKAAREALESREGELNPGQEMGDKKQISFADHDARIVGQHLTQNANDKQEVKQALEEIEDTTGRLPKELSADNGYFCGGNLEALEGTDIDAYIAVGKGEQKDARPIDECDRKVKKSDFIYDEQGDRFVCPGGHTVEVRSECKDGSKVYQALKEDCDGCPYRDRCCSSKKGEPRTISTDDKEGLRQQMVKKMEEESSKEKYKKRKKIVEPVIGQIKNSGFRGFSLRGSKKASGEFSLVCAVHNFKKIVKAILGGKVGPERWELAQVAA
jgi:transposase